MTEIVGGHRILESPDGLWIAVLEGSMDTQQGISLWSVADQSVRLAARIPDISEASFASSTRVDVRVSRQAGPTAIELRDGAWVETSAAPK